MFNAVDTVHGRSEKTLLPYFVCAIDALVFNFGVPLTKMSRNVLALQVQAINHLCHIWLRSGMAFLNFLERLFLTGHSQLHIRSCINC